MLKIGCHLSSAKGYLSMAQEASRIGANTFQFFTRNPRGGAAKAIEQSDIDAFEAFRKENGFPVILAHASYTLNACSPDENIRRFARETMADDLRRMEFTPHNLYNFHPGSHVKQGEEAGITWISEMLNAILKPEQTTTVLLETMAGKGTEIGKTFEQLQEIIKRVKLSEHIGVCLDTCHIWDGGYDIVNGLDGVLEQFDTVIGLKRLRAVHLNDSLNPLGAHKDRHARIGEGQIGLDALARVINHPSLKHLPFYLETPNDMEGYKSEIRQLKSLYQPG